jgi:hypothetical protein
LRGGLPRAAHAPAFFPAVGRSAACACGLIEWSLLTDVAWHLRILRRLAMLEPRHDDDNREPGPKLMARLSRHGPLGQPTFALRDQSFKISHPAIYAGADSSSVRGQTMSVAQQKCYRREPLRQDFPHHLTRAAVAHASRSAFHRDF